LTGSLRCGPFNIWQHDLTGSLRCGPFNRWLEPVVDDRARTVGGAVHRGKTAGLGLP
jgi:hypothetical protein